MQNLDLSRRKFLSGKFREAATVDASRAILPPWADVDIFWEKCTQCGDCIQQCETQVLIKGERGYPEVCFAQAECTFCGKCAEICQQPIFKPITSEAWQHKIAINNACLTQRQVECRSCQDNCQWRAISFKPMLGQVAQPQLNLELCNGCGACVAACPVQAISMLITQTA
ncbi:ferredoxin-type protein NapF [Gallibacterium melopsittaci]|uniref:Ferredoxin-type protein NapF n=1 Tax=Gallibacterium melopsittaci TaxID=516063 RepID=A0ABV6HTL7_9PAST